MSTFSLQKWFSLIFNATLPSPEEKIFEHFTSKFHSANLFGLPKPNHLHEKHGYKTTNVFEVTSVKEKSYFLTRANPSSE